MSKYTVIGLVTISMSTVVEADSEEEALKMAQERDVCSLIAPEQMGDSHHQVWVHSGEIDGAIEDIEIQEG